MRTKTIRTKTILLLSGMLWAGCVPSFNSFYTEKDLVFDGALVGTWRAVEDKEDSKDRWEFTKEGEKHYRLQQTDEKGRRAEFEACLLKLGEHRFLDLYLSKVEEGQLELNSVATFSLIPAHLLFKVDQIQPTLKLAAMNPDQMKKLLTAHPDAIAHRVIQDGGIVLTAGTAELQKFVLAHVNDEEFFGGPMEMKRIAAAESKK